jgi:hypothetical protein
VQLKNRRRSGLSLWGNAVKVALFVFFLFFFLIQRQKQCSPWKRLLSILFFPAAADAALFFSKVS